MRILYPLTFTAFAASGLSAQAENRDVMVVFDMSGSMWGQVDGVAKVEIARDAFDGLWGDWARGDTRSGLIAYGHRTRGDCADIEVLATPDDGAEISTLVAGLSPIGKTPLSDAVRQAAEVLRFTEEAATVVLLSDGVENCSADPCAVGAELEALGLDFTAHVIGFDIAEGDKAQLQCLADATGGQYFDASDAGELAGAMDGVRQATADPAMESVPEPAVDATQTQDVKIRIAMPYGLALPDETILFRDDTEIGRLSPEDAVEPGLIVDLPLGTVNLRAQGDKVTGDFTIDIAADTDAIALELTPEDAGFIMQSSADMPLTGEHLVMINDTAGLDRDIHSRVYLAPVGSTDIDTYEGGNLLSPKAGIFNVSRIPSPAAAGTYDVVVMDARQIVEYGRFPVQFSDNVTPEWLAPREADVGGVIDARWTGDANRQSTFEFRQNGERVGQRTAMSKVATQEGFKMPVPDVAGVYTLILNWSDTDRNRFEADMGLIAVGAAMPVGDGTAADDMPQDYTDLDPTAIETGAMGGEEGPLTPVGDMHGDWILIARNDARYVPLGRFQVIHEQGAQTAEGDFVVEAPDEWGLGAQGSFGTSTLEVVDADTRRLTFSTGGGVKTATLQRDGNMWRAPSDLVNQSSRTTLDVFVLRREDMAAVDVEGGVSILQAYDERGQLIEAPVRWTLESPTAQVFDTIDTPTGTFQVNAPPQGSYTVTATSGDLTGTDIVTVSRSSRANNAIVLRETGEGRNLPFAPAYFCSADEDCDMVETQFDVEFTLPVGWGARTPVRTRNWEITFNMAAMTPDGPVWATLNQPQRSADLGPCYYVLLGTFCHDATDDPQRLADIDIIRRSLSNQTAGEPRSAAAMNTLLNQLTGDSE